MRTLYKSERGEYTEKKSRFIASLKYVETADEAEAFFTAVRKEFYDARHNCTAYLIKNESGIIKRSSDDGEPQGTAGHPMLDVLEKENIVNIAAVVTRYFGGTLLGTGGLVRSYTKALQAALEESVLIERKEGVRITVTLDYTSSGKAEYYFAENEMIPIDKEYSEDIKIDMIVPEDKIASLKNEILSITNGKGEIKEYGKEDYAILNGRILFGDLLSDR